MIVLDTHAWIWWVSNPESLSLKVRREIGKALEKEPMHISAISAWEVAMLEKRGRLKLTMGSRDWIAKSEMLPSVQFIPVSTHIAVTSVELPGEFHDDPADRIIVATARAMNAVLITKDDKILKYPHVKTLW